MRFRGRSVALLLVMVWTTSGCQVPFDLPEPADEQTDLTDSFRFEYDAVGGTGYIDQALTITSPSDKPMVIEAELEAVDKQGEVLPDVDVGSVYGFAEGRLVLMPGASTDFLVFESPDSGRAADVEVSVTEATPVDHPGLLQVVEAVPLTADGEELHYPAGFDQVALRNPNDEAASVRIAFIVWNTPKAGETQQAVEVVEIGGLVDVPAGGEAIVKVSRREGRTMERAARMHASSLKAYFSS